VTVDVLLDDFRNGYVRVVADVLRAGAPASPRGEPTVEVLDYSFTLLGTDDALPLGVGRGVAPRLAAMEALQLVAGTTDPSQIGEAYPAMRGFMDGGSFWGAYGPRARHQMARAVELLRQDPQTRRAVVGLWDERDLYVEGVQNYPCATEVQFLLRPFAGEPELHTFVTMRANDAWRGLAYDVFVFAQLGWSVANALGVRHHEYHHHARSMHLYVGDLELAQHMVDEHVPREFEPLGVRGVGLAAGARSTWDAIQHRAEVLVTGGSEVLHPTPSEEWFLEKLRPAP
jgi:thymidylate synthase